MGGERGGVAGVEEVDPDAQRGELARAKAVRSAVEDALREETVAGAEEREQRGADRGHAAPGHERGLGPLERGQLGLDRGVVRSVVEPDVPDVVVVVLVRLLEGGRLEDRHHHRAHDARAGLASVDDLRLEPPEALTHGHVVGRPSAGVNALSATLAPRSASPSSRSSSLATAGSPRPGLSSTWVRPRPLGPWPVYWGAVLR
jgi:hypothetical protein